MKLLETIEDIENYLSTPSERLIKDIISITGDILILGIGGKMGPSLAKLTKRAIDCAGLDKKVIGASRFSNEETFKELTDFGIECIKVDLMNDDELSKLPNVENVIYMAGNKFGTFGNEHFTWAMNSYIPGRVALKYKESKIVVFSTGNIYPFTSIYNNGAKEDCRPSPIGEYAQSCLGRERVFEHFSIKNNTKILLFRLNYALDLRYGVLLEVAKSVWEERPLDLSMGYVNIIWQGDANEYAIRCLNHCEFPAKKLNITGPEVISIKWLALEFGKLFNRKPIFKNGSKNTALLNDSSQSHNLFGKPLISLNTIIHMTANWVKIGGKELSKPTHFQERKGAY